MAMSHGAAWRRLTVVASMAGALAVAVAAAANTPKAGRTPRADAVTDATVAARVAAARSKADHEALAAYYQVKAAAEEARIAHFDQLFRTYMKLEGKPVEPLQRHARALLKAARMSKQRYALLAQAHLNLVWED